MDGENRNADREREERNAEYAQKEEERKADRARREDQRMADRARREVGGINEDLVRTGPRWV